MRYLPLLLVLVTASCSTVAKGLASFDHVDRPHVVTPNGAFVYTPIPKFLEGQTEAQALGWVDDRIDQWIASHPEHTPAELMNTAHKYTFKLIDDFRFPSPASATGYAEGQIFYDTKYILVCLYTKSEATTKPDPVPYKWMIEFRDNLWKWGVFPADGKGFAVIPHELDHALLGSFH